MVDVLTEIVIHRPRGVVASYASNPENAPEWYTNIKAVDWETAPPLTVGSRVAFRAHFLGRDLDYVYEFTELDPGARLVMQTAQGPFPMQTTYTWADADDSSTRMALRNTGKPAGFSAVVNLVMAPMMRRAMQKDLAKLKQILEAA
ncbi:SRPBCC family protein [Arthrobacter oryzae]|uniref:Polyketide cyclase/dehydrase/lipid transport protein n=1 Tax=Arthrobacter oryzae TaxID=409290 RepID=A0A495EA37_9MICC|nr:SRPBCC family protein [Arthrobacter oryzae]RKR13745.1 polyketide cyclase/dehydrase/lipid transport protein [Arthrobacter oryzae]